MSTEYVVPYIYIYIYIQRNKYIYIYEVKITFEMLTVRGHQHSFSTQDRTFFWKCQSFWEWKCLDMRGTQIPKPIMTYCSACILHLIQLTYNINHECWGKSPSSACIVSSIRNQLSWVWLMSVHIMTSSNGNIFRVTGPLCEEFTGHRWIPLTKASDAELWCFLWSEPE